ncbi:hypothetical protein BT93_L5270 [Corymbia citriodora subsp. variegata]|uniref:Phosphoserine phosphatase n=1 Tax=Corymbia citriodora subsp. variegata TaxID=360336 RepID=A0A8T0CF51_CORYI|nr:hypothetical protein BT93_L5270 [Corymbia citriodora subsp. variegata]
MVTKDLSAMEGNPKFIFFTDFDGTITLKDTFDAYQYIPLHGNTETLQTDNIGFGQEKRKQGNKDVLEGKETFRESFTKMMDSVKKPFPECVDYLIENIKLDPHFNDYFEWALDNNIPTVVLSSGMEPVIRGILKNLVGKNHDKIDIVSNQAKARPGKSMDEEGGWQIDFHDDSDFGHDKSLTIRPYADLPSDKRPTLFYAGDGVSDLSAARETVCSAGKVSVHDAAKEGYEMYKKGEAGVKIDDDKE